MFKQKELVEQFGELLNTGKVVVVSVAPSKKGDKLNYVLAQAVERKMNSELQAQSLFKPEQLSGKSYLQFPMNGVTMSEHATHVKNGLIKLDANNNFVPSVVEANVHIRVKESMKPFTGNIYLKDGELTCSSPKLNPATGAYPAKDGSPIWRQLVLDAAGTKDELVTPNGYLTQDEVQNICSQHIAEFEAAAAVAEKAKGG